MNGRRIFIALLIAMAALESIVVIIRVADVSAHGSLVLFPAEGPVVYAFWRLRHGYTLYEWPMQAPFTLTAYNALFYASYAGILQMFRTTDAGTLVAARFVTLASAVLGAAAQYGVSRRLVAPRGPRLLLLLLSIGTWIGVALPGWWAFSIRPDVPARVFVLLAVAACMQAFAREARGWLFVASVCFLVAWGFKQSNIATLVASCAYIALVRRSPIELVILITPFAAGAAVALGAGGAAYRANLIDAPALSPWVPYLPVHWYRSIAVIDLLPWAIAAWAAVKVMRPVLSEGPGRGLREMPQRSLAVFSVDASYLVFAVVIGFAVTTVLLMKVGSALNHALELHLTASLLCTSLLAAAWLQPRARLWRNAAVALVPMLAFDIAVLAGREQGRAATLLQLKVWGDRLHLAPPAELASRARLAEAGVDRDRRR
jgi:hypothetical protein